jgi:hypothetical protein
MIQATRTAATECLLPSRIWAVALELDRWNAAECQHVAACQYCQSRLRTATNAVSLRETTRKVRFLWLLRLVILAKKYKRVLATVPLILIALAGVHWISKLQIPKTQSDPRDRHFAEIARKLDEAIKVNAELLSVVRQSQENSTALQERVAQMEDVAKASDALMSEMRQVQQASQKSQQEMLDRLVQLSGQRVNLAERWLSAGPPPQLRIPYAAGRKLAVVVGVSNAPPRDPIKAAEDAVEFYKQILVGQLGFYPAEIKLLSDAAPDPQSPDAFMPVQTLPTGEKLTEALDWLRDIAEPSDFAVLFIACHGEVEPRDGASELMFVLKGGERFSAKQLFARFAAARCEVKLAIVDTCFSGLAQRVQADALLSGTRGKTPRIPVLLSSTSPTERSWFHPGTQRGVFQLALRRTLAEADLADANGDRYLTPNEIKRRLEMHMGTLLHDAPEPQVPQFWLPPGTAGDFPLFALGQTAQFGRLTLVGEGLGEARVKVEGQEIQQGFNQLFPGRAAEQAYGVHVTQENRPGGQIGILMTGFPLSAQPYRLTVERKDGTVWHGQVELSSSSPTRVVQLPGKPGGEDVAPQKLGIKITHISQRDGTISGVVHGVKKGDESKYRVLLLIKTDVWYVHPYLESYATIKEGGKWEFEHIVRGSERRVAAVLIPAETKIPALDHNGYVIRLDELKPHLVNPETLDELEYQPEFNIQATQLPVPPAPSQR